jgi:RNA polymerase sigma factor (sigma-70 family)
VLERAKLLGLARRLVHDDDPDDLVQDAAVTALAQPEPPRVLAAWLRQVIRNSARGRTRRQHTRSLRLLEVVEPIAVDSADVSLHHARILDALSRALAALDEPYRTTVHRRFFDDLSPLEIARADGDAPATVRWRLHEGLRRIRTDLDARFGGRREWCGAVAALALPSAPAAVESTASPGVPTMSTSMIAKLALLFGGIGLAVTFASTAHDDEDVEATIEPTLAPSDVAVPAAVVASADGTALASLEPASEAITAPSQPKRDKDFPAAIVDAMETCLADAPHRELRGKSRVEVELAAWTLEDGTSVIETVEVTTGRKMTCADAVDESTPFDAPGVVAYPELSTCVAASIEIDRVRPMRDEFDRVAAHDHTHPSSVVIALDAKGRVDRAAMTDPEPLQLVDVSDEPTPEPEEAVAALGLPQRGAFASAEVRIVECGAYECRFCKKSEATLAALERRRSDVAVAFLHFPLSQSSARLAFAAVAAQRQDRFWDMHRALFEREEATLDRAALRSLAADLGLDVARFERDMDDPATELEVARQRRVCEVAGVFATPTFFINGDLFRGELGIDVLLQNVDEVLADGR